MTKQISPNQAPALEQRYQVRPAALTSTPLFQGWGPRF
jgi:hypothetical protein